MNFEKGPLAGPAEPNHPLPGVVFRDKQHDTMLAAHIRQVCRIDNSEEYVNQSSECAITR